ncbi:MAG: putative succinate dehydrogenase [membrane anchor subunit] (succinic dehydrogenase) [uncultured Rubrobacteraceae bacterium]|uniref:Putative succinate dehydrogenase [membrane anchor subunit] (Succinic dehydrogenase) n=1 Tax=uncultured Rubrobacteraceae bacterium TaxID=349277 RepID=A0A6J4QI37_9ACTN|nr:MAG: putative succinate dehydrogenase [membrane anchor subunit] (succinic dehydrogenase) [uncultured Rubrobacteraceae bacterium]
MADTIAKVNDYKGKLPWWVAPITITVVLTAFGLYSFFIVLFGPTGEYGGYLLSPFYSPPVGAPDWLPVWLSPAAFILWIPLGFRATCYYYRKAYYRAFFWDPPACSSRAQQREPRSPENYRGERNLFVLNNIHRYFFYGSMVVVAFLWIETVRAFFPDGGFGITVGGLIFLVNVVLLSMYSLSCHSFRHLVGGRLDCYSCVTGGKARLRAYSQLSVLNRQHALWAWLSLFSVLFADIYVRLLMAGVFTDFRLV